VLLNTHDCSLKLYNNESKFVKKKIVQIETIFTTETNQIVYNYILDCNSTYIHKYLETTLSQSFKYIDEISYSIGKYELEIIPRSLFKTLRLIYMMNPYSIPFSILTSSLCLKTLVIFSPFNLFIISNLPRILNANIAAFLLLPMPTVATGTPSGICTIE
jgi:hypothetical protein